MPDRGIDAKYLVTIRFYGDDSFLRLSIPTYPLTPFCFGVLHVSHNKCPILGQVGEMPHVGT